MSPIESFRDLRVYRKLRELHLAVHLLSMDFPKFELYELGSQVRRSSNAAPALVAEGWGSRHTNMYIEAISRAMGEIRETQHHLSVAQDKSYLTAERYVDFDDGYDHCGRMLENLHQSLSEWRDSTRTGREIREERESWPDLATSEWAEVAALTAQIMASTTDPGPTTDNR